MSEARIPPTPLNNDCATAFVGRELAFSGLRQHVANPYQTTGLVFVGRRKIGKTALLRAIDATLGPPWVCIYLPLQDISPINEGKLIASLVEHTLEQHPPNTDRQTPEDTSEILGWFKDRYLAALKKDTRPNHIIWLLDDVEHLIKAVKQQSVNERFIASLAELISTQFTITGTLDLSYEDQFEMLAPLFSPANSVRLENLRLTDCAEILRSGSCDYVITDEIIAKVFAQTGGEPVLIHAFAEQFQAISQPDARIIGQNEFAKASSDVYSATGHHMRLLWSPLNQEERLTLSAIAALAYADPLGTITPQTVEGWLINTDFPLDEISVRASLRSLAYKGLVESANASLRIRIQLLQHWLLANTRLTQEMPAISQQSEQALPRKQIWLGLSLIALLLFAIIMILTINDAGGPAADDQPAPTVTLIAEDE